jgi:hypothetical protein
MTYIITGTYNEYLLFLRQSKETRLTTKFIYLEEHLKYILRDSIKVIKYGNWQHNPITSTKLYKTLDKQTLSMS